MRRWSSCPRSSRKECLVNGHGNFGSIEGDRAAAMRYTEARLEKFAEEVYLKDLDKTVPFVPNYDETEKEPEVLPVPRAQPADQRRGGNCGRNEYQHSAPQSRGGRGYGYGLYR